MHEVDLIGSPDFNNEIFADLTNARVQTVTVLPGWALSAPNAMATPEPSTWILGLIGFGILSALGYRRSLDDRRI
jgi:hypothetical protein